MSELKSVQHLQEKGHALHGKGGNAVACDSYHMCKTLTKGVMKVKISTLTLCETLSFF